MNILRCGMHKCSSYLSEEDAKFISYQGKTVPICDSCDDGSYEEIMVGDHRESFKKIEKIRKVRKGFDD